MVDNVLQIKNKLNVENVVGDYIKLQKAGVNFRACCPFHNEKTPSFFVSPSRQSWKCFGCGEGGDMFTFVEMIEGVDFKDAMRALASKAGVELQEFNSAEYSKKKRSIGLGNLASDYFHKQILSERANHVIDYLKERGIKDDSFENFCIGYAPLSGEGLVSYVKNEGYTTSDLTNAGLGYMSRYNNQFVCRFFGRIIFPIANERGDYIAFGGRVLPREVALKMKHRYREDVAKYLNSPVTDVYDKSNILYGFDKAKKAIREKDNCVVAEGYTDVIMAHQEGYNNVVSASGTSFTEGQIKLIGRFTKNITTAFDMDMAGNSATQRSIELAQKMGFSVSVVSLPDGKDPADIIKDDVNLWTKELDNSKLVVEFCIDSALNNYDISTPIGKKHFMEFLLPILVSIESEAEKSHWVRDIVKRVDISEESVWSDIKRYLYNLDKGLDSNNSPRIVQDNISRKDRIEDEIYAHIIKDNSFVDIIVDKINNLDQKYEVNGQIELELNGLLQAIGKYDKISKQFISNEKIILDNFNTAQKKRLNEVLFEAERDGKEFSEKTFIPSLKLYQKIIIQNTIHNLRRKIESSKNKKDLNILLKKVNNTTKVLREIEN